MKVNIAWDDETTEIIEVTKVLQETILDGPTGYLNLAQLSSLVGVRGGTRWSSDGEVFSNADIFYPYEGCCSTPWDCDCDREFTGYITEADGILTVQYT